MTASDNLRFITEMEVFRMLDTLPPTVTGLGMIPAWFLRLGAPYLCRTARSAFPTVTCYGCLTATVENCRHYASTQDIATPTQPSDFRPISITPVLSRSLERFVVRKYIYPALLQPNPAFDLFDFRDQFAFRPSGSTTAAIVAMMHTVRSMLTNND